ncbi:MAG: DUF4428 domain-containing protein [Muricoprocola sp.]
MGLFGKMFDKKVCDVCGNDIGLLGNRKLDDGNLCKECAKKLSPWFEERRHSTVEDIKKQLDYREANKEKVKAFRTTREFAGDSYHVYIDDTKGQFTVTTSLSVENNPDILDLSQVVSCRLNIEQDRSEEQYRDQEGHYQSYNPPRYNYSYDYSIKLAVQSPWFDDMDFKLNSFSVKEHDRMKIMDMENLGNQIVAALGGQPMNGMYGQQINNGMQGNMYGQQMNNGMQGGMYSQQMNGMQGNMYGQQMNGMQGNMYGQQMNGNMQGGMYGQQMNNGMQNGVYNQQMNGGMQNGMYNQQMNGNMQGGMFGQQMNSGMQNGMYNNGGIRCDKCGWVPEDPTQVPKFCPECGDPIDGNDMN